MNYIKFIVLLLFVNLFGCKNDDDLPTLEAETVDYAALTSNETDVGRLCMAEVFSKLLLDEKFRLFVKQKSVGQAGRWNNEIILINYWDKVVYDNFTLFDLIKGVYKIETNLCIQSAEEFEMVFLKDPALVLKVPDIIDAESWDAENTVPFLYVRTIDYVKNEINSDTISMVGIHGSGILDRYYWNVPKYFPVILKKSEDYILVDRNLNFTNGLKLLHFHDFDLDVLQLQNVLTDPVYINGGEFFFVLINKLLKTINEQNEKVKSPFDLVDCAEDCVFACIPEPERKLTTEKIFIDIQNPTALSASYETFYRFKSHLIMEDNLVFLAIVNHVTGGLENWKRFLLGSFRINDLFDVELENSVSYKKYKVNGESYELPELNASINVLNAKSILVDNMVIVDGVLPDDLLVFASYNIKFETLWLEETGVDGNSLLVAEFNRHNVSNYDLFCFYQEKILGFNSLVIECNF